MLLNSDFNKTDIDDHTVDRMAQVIVEIGDGAAEQDLITRGFTPNQIATFGKQATAQAHQIAANAFEVA